LHLLPGKDLPKWFASLNGLFLFDKKHKVLILSADNHHFNLIFWILIIE